MICSNCTQRIPGGAAPALVRIEPHDYPMCSVRCCVRWARRIKTEPAFVAPRAEAAPTRPVVAAPVAPAPVIPISRTAAAALRVRGAQAPDVRERRNAKIRAFWAAMTPAERARRTAKARAARAEKLAEAG